MSGAGSIMRRARARATAERKNARPSVKGQKIAILILGMHRSGTSAFTRILSIAGAELPNKLMGRGEGNEGGHWEPIFLAEYHDAMLEELGSSWRDWRALDVGRLRAKKRNEIKADFLRHLEEDFGDAPLFVLKDPRVCRFAPLFIEALNNADIEVRVVLPIRNPLEVCASLERRDGMSKADAGLLWLRHVLDAERATRSLYRAILSYDGLLSDWKTTFERLSERIDLSWPYSADDIAAQVEQFLQKDMRHHACTTEDVLLDPVLRGWIGEAYEAFNVLERNPDAENAIAKLDRISKEFDRASPILHRLYEDARTQLEAEAARLKEALTEAGDKAEQLTAALAERDGEISNLHEAVAERDGQIDNLAQAVAERDGRIAALTGETVSLTGETVRLDQDLKEAQAVIAQITSGNSWRITRPLREIRRWVTNPSSQAGRYSRGAAKLSKAVYMRLPLSRQTSTAHRLFLAKHAPWLLRAAKGQPPIAAPSLPVAAAAQPVAESEFTGLRLEYVQDNGDLYILDGGRKRLVHSMDVLGTYGKYELIERQDIDQSGIGGRVPKAWSYQDYLEPKADSWQEMREIIVSQLSGQGIEFGAGSTPSPVPLGVTIDYVEYHDLDERKEIFRGTDREEIVHPLFYDSLDRMEKITDDSLDFIIASHVIEHTRNPLNVIKLAYQKLHSGGKLVLVIPDKNKTFDGARSVTSLDHFIEDLERPSRQRDVEHYFDYLKFAAKEDATDAGLWQKAKKMEKDHSDIHFHVWDFDSFSEMIQYSQDSFAPWTHVWKKGCLDNDPTAIEFYFMLTK